MGTPATASILCSWMMPPVHLQLAETQNLKMHIAGAIEQLALAGKGRHFSVLL